MSTWEKLVSAVAAVIALVTVLFLVVRNEPFSDPNQVVLIRIVLSVAAAILGASIPGFLNVGWKGGGLVVRAGGALALFVLTYVVTPSVQPPPASAVSQNTNGGAAVNNVTGDVSVEQNN